jgi:hypothetical protein
VGTEALTEEQKAQQLWNEMAAEMENPTAKESPPDEPKEAKSEGDEPKADQPEDKQDDPPKDDEPKDEPQRDPFLTEIIAKLEAIEKRQRNVEGHIGGLTSQQKKLHEAMEAARRAAPDADAPSKAQVTQAVANPDKWEKLKGEFPEWAEATEDLLGARLAGVQQGPQVDPAEIDRKLEERLKNATKELRQEIVDATLDGVYPGWKEEVNTESFGKWLEAQPTDVKALAESTSVGDAARMLRLYDTHKQNDPSTRITQERKQKLEAAATLPKGVRVPKAKSPDDMSPEELWEYEAQLRDKQLAERGY